MGTSAVARPTTNEDRSTMGRMPFNIPLQRATKQQGLCTNLPAAQICITVAGIGALTQGIPN